MRKAIFFVVLFVSFSIFTMPIFAGTKDGVTPAQESVCDGLRSDGVTKGLYGLCVAYCEAEASSERVLDNYHRKMGPSDPEMPCLDDTRQAEECPCWSDALVSDVNLLRCNQQITFDGIFEYDGTVDVELSGDLQVSLLLNSGLRDCISFVTDESSTNYGLPNGPLTDGEIIACAAGQIILSDDPVCGGPE